MAVQEVRAAGGAGGPRHASAGVAVQAESVSVRFGEVQALQGVSLTVRAGTTHAVIGENGAGKTTLMRVIAAEQKPDQGRVLLGGTVGLVHQQPAIARGIPVLQNIVFGAEPGRPGRIDWTAARRSLTELMDKVGLQIPLHADVSSLNMALRQRVEILRVLYRGSTILLLDEPTTYLSPSEVDGLFEVTHRLVSAGRTVIFVSHKLREIASHCDEATVLRRGQTVAHVAGELDPVGLGRAMTGGVEVHTTPMPRADAPALKPSAATVLEVKYGHARLAIHAGELVGIAGVADNGQDELVDLIAGLRPPVADESVAISGAPVDLLNPIARRRLGLRIIPSHVGHHACALGLPMFDNSLSSEVPPALLGGFGRIRMPAARNWVSDLIDKAKVLADPKRPLSVLSGGNLQRWFIAREFDADVRVVVAHEPTRGVDFVASEGARARLREIAAQGGGVLWLSSDLDELIENCDRIAVLYGGQVVDFVERVDFSLGLLGQLMAGTARRDEESKA